MNNKTEINLLENLTVLNHEGADGSTIINPINISTIVNPNGNATVVNQAFYDVDLDNEIDQSTLINSDIASASNEISIGTIIAGKYEIVRSMKISSGEADIYICKYNGDEYVAKLYRRQTAIKPEIIAKLKTIKSLYVAPLCDTGEYNGLPFEILPYYRNGSLQGRKFTLDELKNMVIPCINEGLKTLHDNNVIHKDLKPSNIMMADDGKSVAIIDFGISSYVEDGSTVIQTKAGMTPEYSAPETFRNLFLEESDYYSFGITLYELYSGSKPYDNLSTEQIVKLNVLQRIIYPSGMPQELQNLISGLTYFDLTNRHDKNNPNRRWTYQEVDKWCNGIEQIVPGEGGSTNSGDSIPPYPFLGEKYTSVSSLITELANNWKEGKKQLYRGLLSSYFKSIDQEIAGYCIDAEEESHNNDGDLVFWKLLYKIYPNLKGFYWKGHSYESFSALGTDMLEKLRKKDSSDYSYWDDILKNKLLSSYFGEINKKNKTLYSALYAIEMTAKLENSNTRNGNSGGYYVGKDVYIVPVNNREKVMNYYAMAYLLSTKKEFIIDGEKFEKLNDFTKYLSELLNTSYDKFEKVVNSLISNNNILDEQFEAWLIALGKRKEIDEWRKSLQS